MLEGLASSLWARVDLTNESAVCDFLADYLFDPVFFRSYQVATKIAFQKVANSPTAEGPHAHLLEVVAGNLKALLVTRLPRRRGGTFLAALAKEGHHLILSGCLDLLKNAPRSLADLSEDFAKRAVCLADYDGKTCLWQAAGPL